MTTHPFLEKLLDGQAVEWKPLGEVGEIIRGNGLQKKDFTDIGIPAIHYGQIYTKFGLCADKTFSFVSEKLAKKLRVAETNDLLIATTSENDEDVVKPLAWLGGKAAISGDMMLFRHKENVKYLAYYFQTDNFQFQKKRYITGTKVRRVSKDNLAKIKFPIPPLSVQKEIVNILDLFSKMWNELANELALRLSQYNYYRDKLLTFDDSVKWCALGEVGEVRMCKRILKNQTSDNDEIPFYKIGTFGKKADAFIPKKLFNEYKSRYHYPKKGDILISASGTIGRTVIFDGKDAYFQDSNIVWIENNESQVLNKFLFYFYQIAKWNTAEGGTIKRLYNNDLKKLKIPIPPLTEQQRIVDILDQFDTLTTSMTEGIPKEIELRQKQYEYYRDLLLDFPKLIETA